jgi:hypothetical protein
VRRPHVPALAAIVGASFIVRMALGWLRAVPALFPDEYTYAALGRSIAESGRPLVRGASPHFPALLQPIVTAPAWLIDDVGLAYRLVQTIGALGMSLAAVPVFLLARRLGLSTRVALTAAGLAVLVPDLVYASFVSSEALAYPILLFAVYAGTRVVARPSRKGQLVFFGLAAVATLARIQFAVLPVVFLGTVALVGLREKRLKAALREQVFPLLLFALPALALLAAGPGRALGPYRAVLGFHGSPLGVAKWGALDAMTLAYAAGWIVVPGALLGLWLTLARPRSREELAFGAWVALLTGILLVEAGVLQTNVTLGKEIQERYVFYAVPLLGLCFALYAARGWPLRVSHLALAAVLVLVSVRLPLSGYAIPATVDGSPILYAVYWLSGKLGEAGAASLVVAALAGVLAVVAVLASRRPRVGTPVVLGLALLATGAASAGAVAFDVVNTGLAKRAFLPSDPSWVDRAHVGRVSLLQAWGGIRAASLQELFWNRSVDRVLLLPGASSIDRYGEQRVTVAKDGSLLAGGQAVTEPLLVDGFGSTVRLGGARLFEAGPTASLWVPAGRPRLSLYAIGRYHDGWLADRGAVYLWPEAGAHAVSGWLSMRLTAPRRAGKIRLTFRLPGGTATSVQVRPGQPQRLNIQVCGNGSWSATFRSDVHGMVGLRMVSVKATAPVFRAGASACPEPEAVG